MRRDTKLERIRQLPCFWACSERDIVLVGKLSDQVVLDAGSRINSGRGFFVVLDGQIEIERDGESVATLTNGEHFGDLEALLPESRGATIAAATRTHLLTLGPREFLGLIDAAPAFRNHVLHGLARRAHEAEQPERRRLTLVPGLAYLDAAGQA